MRRFSLILATVGLALAALPAAAQDRTGSWEISPFAGGYFGGTLYDSPIYVTPFPGAVPLYSGHVDVSTDVAYGVRFAYNVNRWFGVEFDWTRSKPDLKANTVTSSGFYGPEIKVGRLTQDVYEANALFNWGKRRAIGYFGLGAGAAVMKTELNGIGSNSDTRFTGSLSLGGKFFFAPHFGVRIDGRYRFTDVGHTTGHHTDCDIYGYCYGYRSEWYSSGEMTGGLIFAF